MKMLPVFWSWIGQKEMLRSRIEMTWCQYFGFNWSTRGNWVTVITLWFTAVFDLFKLSFNNLNPYLNWDFDLFKLSFINLNPYLNCYFIIGTRKSNLRCPNKSWFSIKFKFNLIFKKILNFFLNFKLVTIIVTRWWLNILFSAVLCI